jgi:hypothetical protein
MTAIVVFAATFVFYLRALYPVIAPRDAADMAAAAMTLGVAHPPGYPFYSLLGHAWNTLFVLGNAAYKLNLLSALAGAATVCVLFLIARRRAGTLGAVCAAGLTALSLPLWKFSLLQEKYALHAFVAVLLAYLSEGERDSLAGRARLSGLILGLGLVNHQSLLFWIPGLFWMWRAEARRWNVRLSSVVLMAIVPCLVGLMLTVFLWIRLGDDSAAIDVFLRKRYGSGTLFAGFETPVTLGSLGRLTLYALEQIILSVGWPAALVALFFWRRLSSEDTHHEIGWLIGAIATGPLFVLCSRFNTELWVARTVLEPAFILPGLALALSAGRGIDQIARKNFEVAAVITLFLPLVHLAQSGVIPYHRDDFLAYDYVRDLRRAVPPGGALLVAGDTASFGLRWLTLVSPENNPRQLTSAKLSDSREWLARHDQRQDAYMTGLGITDLQALGFPPRLLSPEGLVQHVGADTKITMPLSVLRLSQSWKSDESYARDVKLSYAYSSWLTARLLEARKPPVPTADYDLRAVLIDPEDYQLQ